MTGKRISTFQPRLWVKTFPSFVLDAFDEMFGKKIISKRSFLISSFLSIILMLLVTLSFLSMVPGYSISGFITKLFSEVGSQTSIILLVSIIMMNIIPDYVSIIETRWIIGRIGENPTVTRILFFITIDLIITASIFLLFCSTSIAILITLNSGTELDTVITRVIKLSIDLSTNLPSTSSPYSGILSFSYYTTFSTSIWVIIFSVSSLLTVLMHKIGGPLWNILVNTVLDVESKPFQSLAWVFGSIVILVYVVLLPVVLL